MINSCVFYSKCCDVRVYKLRPTQHAAYWLVYALLAAFFFFANNVHAQMKVVGYMPSWKGSADTIDYDRLTHIIYSFSLPRASGTLSAIDNEPMLRSIVQKAHAKNVKVLLAIGGWNNGDDSAWEALTTTSAGIDNFVKDALFLVNTYNLDGIDLDWEYPSSPSKWNALVSRLAPELKSRGKLLTAAVAGNGANAAGVGRTDLLDFLNIMIYDCNCPTNAPMQFVYDSISYWAGRGVPKEKRIIGVPFYGTDNSDSMHRQKTRYAMQQGGGIMIWEIAQDPNRYLTSIVNEMGRAFGNSSSSSSACTAWVEGTWYPAGSRVTHKGKAYKALNANPGYIPDVSTWYWEIAPGACPVNPSNSCDAWEEGKWYPAGSRISFNGAGYEALNDNPGYIPNVSTWYWKLAPGACSNQSSSSSSSIGSTCPAWVEGKSYGVGTLVSYKGRSYVAKNANPGYIPDVSTWYWEPTTKVCAGGNGSMPETNAKKIVGYFPSWSSATATVQYDKLTHINYSFLLPNADGSLKPVSNPAVLTDLVKRGHAAGVKIGIALGGWNDGDDSAFNQIAASAQLRATFIANLMSFINTHALDGVDMDWEHPTPGTREVDNYALLMKELGTALHAKNKFLTAAVIGAGSLGAGIKNSVFEDVDFLNIMAYDANSSNHSDYSYAYEAINYWKSRGLSADKIVLGVPYYARPSWGAYKDIVAQGAWYACQDTANGNFYNGIPTIREKAKLAKEQVGGIMTWELTQDTSGSNSLLRAMWEVMTGRTPSYSCGSI